MWLLYQKNAIIQGAFTMEVSTCLNQTIITLQSQKKKN